MFCFFNFLFGSNIYKSELTTEWGFTIQIPIHWFLSNSVFWSMCSCSSYTLTRVSYNKLCSYNYSRFWMKPRIPYAYHRLAPNLDRGDLDSAYVGLWCPLAAAVIQQSMIPPLPWHHWSLFREVRNTNIYQHQLVPNDKNHRNTLLLRPGHSLPFSGG